MLRKANCSTPYRYRAFGLHIASDLLLPELLPDEAGEAEVRVVLGRLPSGIEGAVEENNWYQVAVNEFLFRVRGVGGYYVTSGNRIVVEPEEQAEEPSIRLFLLGTALGVLLLQRGVVPIHGSAVVGDGYGVIFTGPSGAGKSTLSAAFRAQGYAMLADDVAAVVVADNGTARVQSGYPQQKLWRDSARVMGVDTASQTPVFSVSSEDKFGIPVPNGFCRLPVPLGAVYELTVGGDTGVKRLGAVDRLTVLLNNTYRCWLVHGLGLKEPHFRQCLAIAGGVAVSRLTRPEGIFSLADQVRLVQEDLAKLYPAGKTDFPIGDCKNGIYQRNLA